VGAATAGRYYLCVKKRAYRKEKQACQQIPFDHEHHVNEFPKQGRPGHFKVYPALSYVTVKKSRAMLERKWSPSLS
jgi:hypothetical protein